MIETYSNRIDTWFNQTVFLVTSGKVDWVQVDCIRFLFAELKHLNFRFVVLFDSHGSEVSDAQSNVKSSLHIFEVVFES